MEIEKLKILDACDYGDTDRLVAYIDNITAKINEIISALQEQEKPKEEVGVIEEIKKEYAFQDNRATAYPIYVTVQELICVGVLERGYSVIGDGETKTEYRINNDSDPDICKTEEQAIELLKEQFENDPKGLAEAIENIEEFNVGYLWIDVEFFLTIKGAEEYIKANAHNHGKLRTYVKWFETRNFEMRKLLKALNFRTT